MAYDIITFGSATLDIFLETDHCVVKKEKRFRAKKAVCFPFSSKVKVKGIHFATGGGGTNTAAFFALQGFETAYCGTIGRDFAGSKVVQALQRFGVSEEFLFQEENVSTNLSLIFSWKEDRTCFVWREASESLEKERVPWSRIGSEWFYLAPLSGELSFLFDPLVSFAGENEIRVFANPGHSQINLGVANLKPVLDKIDILLLNQEEASLLTGTPYRKEKKVFQRLDELVPGLAIMTKGKKGAVASDGKHIWRVKALSAEVKEKTGAGDSFGSGFLAGYIKEGSVEAGLQMGIANSASCVQKRGAKEGLIKKGESWKKARVEKEKI